MGCKDCSKKCDRSCRSDDLASFIGEVDDLLNDVAGTMLTEVEDLLREDLLRGVFIDVGVDWCTLHCGVRYAGEDHCDMYGRGDKPCQLVPVGFIE